MASTKVAHFTQHTGLSNFRKQHNNRLFCDRICQNQTYLIAHFSNPFYYIFIIYISNHMSWQSFNFIWKTCEATALQSSNSRKIDLYSEYRKKNYRCLLKQMWLMNRRCTDSKFAPSCLPWTEKWNTAPASPQSPNSRLNINCKQPLWHHVN